MRRKKRDPAYVRDMLNAANYVAAFIGGRTFEEYAADPMVQSAVERQIEIVGEAARNMTPAFCERHPEIPWRAIKAQRHVLAHEYDDVAHERVWRVATVHLPALVSQLEAILVTLEKDES